MLTLRFCWLNNPLLVTWTGITTSFPKKAVAGKGAAWIVTATSETTAVALMATLPRLKNDPHSRSSRSGGQGQKNRNQLSTIQGLAASIVTSPLTPIISPRSAFSCSVPEDRFADNR